MKKSLIALAVLAASGASFAQVAVTGTLAMGYKATTTGGAASTDASGFGVDTSQINFAASEDLGGGMKIKATMALAGADRSGESSAVAGGPVSGRDAALALSSSMGTLTLATSEQNRAVDATVANVGIAGLENALFGGTKANYDSLSYSTNFGPVAVSLRHSEPTLGLGVGSAGAATQRENKVGAVYTAGSLAVEASYAAYDNKAPVFASQDTALTLAGAYDLGMVKLGLGYQNNKMGKGSVADTVLAAAMPMGALSLSAELGNRKVDGDNTVGVKDGTQSGYALQAQYDLSKRTALRARYARWDSAVGVANPTSFTSLLAIHSF